MPFNLDGSFILALIMAICTWIATWVNLKIKSDVQNVKADVDRANYALETRIASKLDEFRRDIANGFLPQGIAQEQRLSTTNTLLKLEKEIEKNRDRLHEISGPTMTQITGEIFRMNNQLMDKARRLATIEARLENLHNDHLSLERSHEELVSDVRDHHKP